MATPEHPALPEPSTGARHWRRVTREIERFQNRLSAGLVPGVVLETPAGSQIRLSTLRFIEPDLLAFAGVVDTEPIEGLVPLSQATFLFLSEPPEEGEGAERRISFLTGEYDRDDERPIPPSRPDGS